MRLLFNGLLFATSIVPAFSGPPASPRPPNIILILADDMGFECVGANGGTSYKTPNLDRLAAQGIRFEHCHSQPVCTPSRVQIMTGQYNVRNYTKFSVLDRNQVTFAHLLKSAGYKTVVAGKWQLGKETDSPQHFGFEQSLLWQQSVPATVDQHDTRYPNPTLELNGVVQRFTQGEYGEDVITDFLCQFMEENQAGPFFAYYPMLLPHCPFGPTPDSKDYDPTDRGSRDYKGQPEYFGDMVAYVDKMVGKLVAKVEALGIAENTVILFTGDNGTDQPIRSMLRGREILGGKHNTSDTGTHVPFIARWDGHTNPGTENFDLIDFSDFLPTMVELAGVTLPEGLIIDGVSFYPQLRGREGSPRDWIYGWYSKPGDLAQLKEWARDHTYKLYTTGEFYNVHEDYFEQQPIALDRLGEEERRAQVKLSEVLARYQEAGAHRKPVR